ncbi:MAG: serine/threonine-protein kinase [Pseudomonadota bacterium]
MEPCTRCPDPKPERSTPCDACDDVHVNLPPRSPDPMLGRVVAGKFRIEAMVGQGGMGKVYRATQLSLDKTVALKLLHASCSEDELKVQRFHREARASSRLTHPNAISIIDFGQDTDGTLYMAMEFVRGQTGMSLLRSQFPFDEKRVARIVQQACHALAQAHDRGLVHRDLKLDNIMIDDRPGREDFVKVLDFGIAKLLHPEGQDARTLTSQGFVCGTPEYMAPEQVVKETIDHRTDIYALGIVMYQLVTGQLPFKGYNIVEVAAQQVATPPRPPQDVAPHLPISDEMQSIILICLQKNPAQRFQSTRALAHALDAIVAGRVHFLGSLAAQTRVSTRTVTAIDDAASGPALPVQDKEDVELRSEELLSPAAARLSPRGLLAVSVLGSLATLAASGWLLFA